MKRRPTRGNVCAAGPRRRGTRRWSFEPLEARQLLAADLIIHEFLAANNDGLVDGDGQASDWIEIFNPGEAAADLGGYALTDDPAVPAKWPFPAGVRLDAGEYLVVFASGRDTVDEAGNLHTNFRLSAEGEYLALVDPQQQVLSEFGSAGTDYPRQYPDVSFGLQQIDTERSLVAIGTEAQIYIPTAGIPDDWMNVEFPAAGWGTGPTGVGYDVRADRGVAVPGGTAILQLDVNDRNSGEAGDANTEVDWQPFSLASNGQTFQGIQVTVSPLGGIGLDDRDRPAPLDDPPEFTLDQVYDDFLFARSQTDDTGLEILLQGLVPGQEYQLTLWSYDTGSIDTRVSRWFDVTRDPPVAMAERYTFDGRLTPRTDRDHTITATVTASAAGEVRVQGTRNGGTSFGVFLNGLQLVTPTLEEAVRTDLKQAMHGRSAAALLRIPFSVEDVAAIDELALHMQYDAGFVAYLNGTEVVRRNAPGTAGQPVPPGSVATSSRPANTALVPEIIRLDEFLGLLVPGSNNVLAIHGLNASEQDADFLLAPELVARSRGEVKERFFAIPTPGQANLGASYAGVVGDTRFSVDRGFYDSPQLVTITSSTPGASIAFTTDGSIPSPENGTQVHAAAGHLPATADVLVSTTSYLRAIAYKPDYLPSNVDTQTYLFLEDVLRQDPTPGEGDLPYPATWQASRYRADYQMDPEVVAQWDDQNPDNSDVGIRQALKSLPSMSIVMEHDDLWGRNGIYPNAQNRGTSWRRPASVEYIDPQNGEQFQVDAGVQMHGGASRDNERTKKHSFRLLFSEEFGGPAQLNFPLFQDSPLERINTIVLKSFFTDGFPTRTQTGRYSPLDSQYLRDTWMRDVRRAMGDLEAHSEYVHLYINGLYWGLYSPTERPDDAFLAGHLGGERTDYDVIKDFNELFRGDRTAWQAMFQLANDGLNSLEAYQRIQGNNPDGTRNSEYPRYLDVDNLINYMILHLYAGAEDWPHHNWYAARSRRPDTPGFQFFTWDQEIVLDGRFRNRTTASDANSPARLYAALRRNPEFQLRFADRVYEHFFHDGALTVEKAQQLWKRRAEQIEPAIVAESARWGDAREGERHRIDAGGPVVTIPVMTIDLWRAERDNVHDNYIPRSHELALRRFRALDLYPAVDPPIWNQRGGLIRSEFDIQLLAAEGEIYYTTDGSDPRAVGGMISPTARRFDGPIRLDEDAVVKVRVRAGEQWSALDQAFFQVDTEPASVANLRITEIHYHPAEEADAEFIELTNIGARPISLHGVRFTEGIRFDFSNSAVSSLSPGDHVIVVRDRQVFAQHYDPTGLQIAGQYTDGALRDGGETLELRGADDRIIQRFTYDDDPTAGWTALPDGRGPSLQVIQVQGDYDHPGNWRASALPGGTPGRPAYTPGDANLDGLFDSRDLIQIFQSGKYESATATDVSWGEGDWTGDGRFDTQDLIAAFRAGRYVPAARPDRSPLPLPTPDQMDARRQRQLAVDQVLSRGAWES